MFALTGVRGISKPPSPILTIFRLAERRMGMPSASGHLSPSNEHISFITQCLNASSFCVFITQYLNAMSLQYSYTNENNQVGHITAVFALTPYHKHCQSLIFPGQARAGILDTCRAFIIQKNPCRHRYRYRYRHVIGIGIGISMGIRINIRIGIRISIGICIGVNIVSISVSASASASVTLRRIRIGIGIGTVCHQYQYRYQ